LTAGSSESLLALLAGRSFPGRAAPLGIQPMDRAAKILILVCLGVPGIIFALYVYTLVVGPVPLH
jgi:hypothetical protein